MIITALKAAGLPAVVGVVQGLNLLSGKKQADMRKWGHRFFETEFAGQTKSIDASNSSLLARTLCTTPPRRVHWRSIRSYLLADQEEVVPLDGPKGATHGTLHVRGYIRGRPLGVNGVVHVGDVGHFGLRQINSAPEPFSSKPKSRGGGAVARQRAASVAEGEVLAMADPGQRDLSVEATVDGLAGEQTWPTEQELAQAGEHIEGGGEGMDTAMSQEDDASGERHSSGAKALPPGWSGYQAEWLAGTGSVEGDNMDLSDEGEAWALDEEKADDDGLGDLTDASLDAARRQVAENEDTRFPDEVDTPADRSARERYARFRALKSFRTSPWDPKESLPKEYARIFQVGYRQPDSVCRNLVWPLLFLSNIHPSLIYAGILQSRGVSKWICTVIHNGIGQNTVVKSTLWYIFFVRAIIVFAVRRYSASNGFAALGVPWLPTSTVCPTDLFDRLTLVRVDILRQPSLLV